MIAKELRQQTAFDQFLATNPDLQAQISGLSAKEQAQQVEWEFEAHAEEQGLEVWELVLETIATSPEELKTMRLEVHQEVAEALGMDWEDYRQLNELDDHEFDHGPGVDEAPLNDLDDGESGLDPQILDDDQIEDGSLGLG